MDKKKTSPTASSSSGKHGEKKDENFLTKTAHSIRDKVHELTDDVKEKTHNLTHSSDSKKNKKDKDQKKTDTKSKTSSKIPTAGKKDSGSDSDDEDDSPKPMPPSGASSAKKDYGRDADKSGTIGSKPSAAAAATSAEKKDIVPSTSSRFPSDKPASGGPASRSSNDHKDAGSAAPPSSPSSKPSGENSATKPLGAPSNNDPKPSIDKSNKATDGGDATHKLSSGENNSGQVHISLDGILTVDDLLDRIDDAIEKAKIVVENPKGVVGLNIGKTTRGRVPSPADLEKKPIKKAEDHQNKVEDKKEGDQKEEEEEEPIRIDYKEIHKIEDLILKVNKQPGNRKVILENTPGNSGSITIQKQANPPSTARLTSTISNENDFPPPSTTTNENDDSSGPPKSILKTSQNPSSLDTSTKTSSFQDDHIHVNIDGVQNVDEFLDCVDNAVQNVPVVIDAKSQGEKRHAPPAPNQNDNNNQFAASTYMPTQKREAPKAPSSTNDQNTHSSLYNKQSTSSSSSIEEKKDEGGTNDWI